MPTVTVSNDLLETLGVRLEGVEELSPDLTHALEAILASRGFSVRAIVHVTELADGRGFLLTQ